MLFNVKYFGTLLWVCVEGGLKPNGRLQNKQTESFKTSGILQKKKRKPSKQAEAVKTNKAEVAIAPAHKP